WSVQLLAASRMCIAGMDLPVRAIGNVISRTSICAALHRRAETAHLSQMRRMPLCEKPSWRGEPVVVAIPEEPPRSNVLSPRVLPFQVPRKFSTLIRKVGTTENSGSGVFDAGNKCPLGIISQNFPCAQTVETPKASKKVSPKISCRHRLFAPSYQVRIAFRRGWDPLGSRTRRALAPTFNAPSWRQAC